MEKTQLKLKYTLNKYILHKFVIFNPFSLRKVHLNLNIMTPFDSASELPSELMYNSKLISMKIVRLHRIKNFYWQYCLY